MFKHACYEAGAKQVSDEAAVKFDAWMSRFMVDVAMKAVRKAEARARMGGSGLVKVEKQDIGE